VFLRKNILYLFSCLLLLLSRLILFLVLLLQVLFHLITVLYMPAGRMEGAALEAPIMTAVAATRSSPLVYSLWLLRLEWMPRVSSDTYNSSSLISKSRVSAEPRGSDVQKVSFTRFAAKFLP
jgi:hypothetical protein